MRKYCMIATLALLLAACVKEKPNIDEPQGEPVTITLKMPHQAMTRATDSTLNTLRVLVYKSSNGTLQFNVLLNSNIATATQQLEVRTGKYDVVFVANEDEMTPAARNVLVAGPSTMDDLQKIVTRSNSGFYPDGTHVMVTHYKNVEILGDDKLTYNDPFAETYTPKSVDGGEWEVVMERLAVDFDFWLEFNRIDAVKMRRVMLIGAREKSWLMPLRKDNSEHISDTIVLFDSQNGYAPTVSARGTEMYISEYYPSPTEKGMEVRVELVDRTVSAHLDSCLIVPRNTRFEVNCTIAGPKLFINNVTVVDWSAEKSVPVEERNVVLPAEGARYLATPGVLGVDVVTGKLTVAGSKQYPAGNFGTPSTNTVYAALFKWQSRIALSWGGRIDEDWTGEGNQWNLSDVMYYPAGHNPMYVSDAYWASIGYNYPVHPQEQTTQLGDPCALVTDGGKTWKMPTATDPVWSTAWSISSQPTANLWSDATQSLVNTQSLEYYRSGNLLLPSVTGYRDQNGVFRVDPVGARRAEFWTANYQDDDFATLMRFSNTATIPTANTVSKAEAHMIRCVEA